MKAVTKMLAGGLGIAALAAAAPAAAQYYPQPYPQQGYPQPYPQQGYPQQGYGQGYGNQGGVLGTILDSLLGGRRYAQNDRQAVEQCVRAVEYRINTRGFDNQRGRYQNYGYGQGYNNQYRNYQGARVVSVTDVDRRSNGGLRIRGLASSGAAPAYGYGNQGYGYGNQGYGYGNQGYGYGNQGYGQQADARFNCNVDRFGRIIDIDARRVSNSQYYRR